MKLILLLFSLNVFAGVTINGTPSASSITAPGSSTDRGLVTWGGTSADTLGNITNAPILGSDGDIFMQKTTGSSTDCYIGADTTGDCTGFYFGSGGPTSAHGLAFNGTNIWDHNATSFNFYIRSYFAPAACSSPGLGVRTDTNTGLCRNEADHLAIATDGVARLSAYGEAVETVGVPHYISGAGVKLILTSPDGTCSECGVDNSDAFSCASVTCPTSP